MKIGFCSLDWSNMRDETGTMTPGGAGWYRCGLPAKVLAENGIATVYGPDVCELEDGSFGVVDWDRVVHQDCDVVVLQRWMEDHTAECILKARATGQVVINDVDDHYDGLATTNIAWWQSHPRINPKSNRNHYAKVLAASSGLTVSTPYLAERLARRNDNILVVPNAIDCDRWPQVDISGPMRIGWVGATLFRSGDLETLRGILGNFCSANDVPFHHSGHAKRSPPASEQLSLPDDVPFTDCGMANIIEYPKLFQHFNVGIVPLSDTPFNYAKSGIKGLEYASSGIPFVASRTPAYDELGERGIGLIAKRPRDWTARLRRLLDPDERQSVAQTASVAVRAYDIASRWTDWRDAYQTALTGF